jgi:hypothetical protein
MDKFKTQAKGFALFFVIQMSSYFLVTINQRGVVTYDYTSVIITDVMIASLGYFVIKKIASSTDAIHQWAGYVSGGVTGSVIALWLSQHNFL